MSYCSSCGENATEHHQGLVAENERLRALYDHAVALKARGWTIDHLLECEEALRTVQAAYDELHGELDRAIEEIARLGGGAA